MQLSSGLGLNARSPVERETADPDADDQSCRRGSCKAFSDLKNGKIPDFAHKDATQNI
jgi:hypothetical protein